MSVMKGINGVTANKKAFKILLFLLLLLLYDLFTPQHITIEMNSSNVVNLFATQRSIKPKLTTI